MIFDAPCFIIAQHTARRHAVVKHATATRRRAYHIFSRLPLSPAPLIIFAADMLRRARLCRHFDATRYADTTTFLAYAARSVAAMPPLLFIERFFDLRFSCHYAFAADFLRHAAATPMMLSPLILIAAIDAYFSLSFADYF